MPEDNPDKKDKPKSWRVGQIIASGPNKWLVRIFIRYKPNGSNDYFNKMIHGTKTASEKSCAGLMPGATGVNRLKTRI